MGSLLILSTLLFVIGILLFLVGISELKAYKRYKKNNEFEYSQKSLHKSIWFILIGSIFILYFIGLKFDLF